MNTELESVKKKIAKLLALGNGAANQNESQIALQRAGDLMKNFALSISDIELGDEKIVKKVINAKTRSRPTVYANLMSLAEFTSVKLWITRPTKWEKNGVFQTHVLGYESDIMMFEFFYEFLENAFANEWANYKTTARYKEQNKWHHGRAIRSSFLLGFSQAINETLRTLISDVSTATTKTGTELVPLKNANVEDFFQNVFNIRLRTTRTKSANNVGGSYSSGSAAGAKVRFNRPVKGGSNGGRRLISG